MTTRIGFILLSGVFMVAAVGCADGDGKSETDTETAGNQKVNTDTVDLDCPDIDRDGHCAEVDCNDRNPDIGPGATEICGNALDDNCNGEVDEDCMPDSAFYVDKDSKGGPCRDDGPGTLTEPWCTVEKASNTLTANQVAYLREGTYQETISPKNSGKSDTERITFAALDGENVTFTESVYCIRLQSVSYITVTGIRFFNCERNLYMKDSSRNNIVSCEFDTPQGPTTWSGSLVNEKSRYNRITYCTFSHYGEEGDGEEDSGIVLDFGSDAHDDPSDYNLVMYNTFSYGGHHILGIYSNYNVVRNNTFHNEEWYPCHRTETGGLCGNRDIILNTSNPNGNIRNVIDDNTIAFAGVPPDNDTSTGLSVRTQSNIMRRNLFYHCDSTGITLSNDGGNSNNSSNNYIYQNVFYHNGYMLYNDWEVEKSGLLLARWVDDDDHQPMTGVAVKNNIFYDNQLYGIYYYYVDEAAQDAANNFEEAGDPGFVDISGEAIPSDFTVFDFHLKKASPCIDAGGFLTTAEKGGDNETALEVTDAGYFTDGFGIVEGDFIQLENQSTPVQIEKIDYDTNTITLKDARSWSANSGVSLPYFGKRPDQGVFEFRE